MKLDDRRALEALDRHATHRVLAEFPSQCRRALDLASTPPAPATRPRLVIVAGMGGSASGGDMLAACAAETLDVLILVHRGYGLPAAARPDSLVLAVSYSGDTVEVLSATEAALARGVPVVAITAGGALGALADRRGLPRVAVPAGLMPRMALGYLVFPALSILAACGAPVVTSADVDEALDVLTAQAKDLGLDRPSPQNEAKRLALAIGERLPAVYGGPLTGAVAYRWKTDLEENAKTLAVAGALPEMNHNEIEAWRAPAAAAMHAVFLRDRDESSEIERRFAVMRELIAAANGDVSECSTRGTGRAARLLGLAYLGAWTSYYVAIGAGTDPWPIPVLDEMKRRLRAP